MLSIMSNPQVKFRGNNSNERIDYNDSQNTNLLQEEDVADSFESENNDTEPQVNQNNSRIPKFVRDIILGTALAGGLTAAAPKAQAQQLLDGQVITEQKQVDPKDASKGTATYYYTNEAVMDSMISDYGKIKRTQKFDRTLLNTYPVMKYSYKNIEQGHSYIYNYTIAPEEGSYYLKGKPELKTLSGKKIVDYEDETSGMSTKDRDEREPKYLYTPVPPEEPFFNNPALQDNVINKGSQIIKSGKFTDPDTNEQYTTTAYYTKRPVLDSVIVKKPNGDVTKTIIDRDVDLKSVTHVGRTYPDNKTENLWLDFDNNNFIKYENLDTNGTYLQETFVPVKPTTSKKK